MPPLPALIQLALLAPKRAGADFGGVAKLAQALEKLNPSGRFPIGSVVFAAAAAVVAVGIGSIS
jgi:hypothetical protein